MSGETGEPVLSHEDANWSLVKNALARMAEEQTQFLRKLEARLQLNDQLLIGRFDDVDAALLKQERQLDLYNAQLAAMNQLFTGLRSASDSTYDMALTATRKIERVRKFLNVPDEVVNDPAPVAGTASPSDSPPRPIR